MRIIAGRYKSRHLKASVSPGIRPTSDKLRETLFNILGDSVRGCTFLDGCAGVGAIGIEAISRGASMVVFVDESRKASGTIRENLKALDIQEGVRILEMDLVRGIERCAREAMRFDVAFIDPPYGRKEVYESVLRRVADLSVLTEEGVLIFEHYKSLDMPEVQGALKRVRQLVQGDSALSFYRPEQL